LALFVLIAAAAGPRAALAGDGDLDPSFDGDGLLTLPLPPLVVGEAHGVGVRVRPDGRIVVLAEYRTSGAGAGSALLLYQLLPSGALDPEFGAGGIEIVHPPDPWTIRGVALELAPDGGIVVAGDWYISDLGQRQWLIGRRLADGSLDPDFGSPPGWAIVEFEVGAVNWLEALAVDGAGGIVASGWAAPPVLQNVEQAAFARWTPAGELDSGFSDDGKLKLDLVTVSWTDGQVARIHDVAIEADTGAVVFAGESAALRASPTPDIERWVLGRLTPEGTLDPAFAGGAWAEGDFGVLALDPTYPRLASVLPLADGSYRGAGSFYGGAGGSELCALVAVTSYGAVDVTWGGLGHFGPFVFSDPGSFNRIDDCVLDRAERTVCAGDFFQSLDNWIGYARFDGAAFDSRLRGGGRDAFRFGFGAGNAYAADLTIDPNGRIVILGTWETAETRAAVARLFGGLPFTDGFESGLLEAWSMSNP